jgi:hypothetical protein
MEYEIVTQKIIACRICLFHKEREPQIFWTFQNTPDISPYTISFDFWDSLRSFWSPYSATVMI